eukprot:m.503206 g.503206  ORF g.503206 m.503206 type:complete len:441 (-) comp21844_c1_seq29:2764-4086(-)
MEQPGERCSTRAIGGTSISRLRYKDTVLHQMRLTFAAHHRAVCSHVLDVNGATSFMGLTESDLHMEDQRAVHRMSHPHGSLQQLFTNQHTSFESCSSHLPARVKEALMRTMTNVPSDMSLSDETKRAIALDICKTYFGVAFSVSQAVCEEESYGNSGETAPLQLLAAAATARVAGSAGRVTQNVFTSGPSTRGVPCESQRWVYPTQRVGTMEAGRVAMTDGSVVSALGHRDMHLATDVPATRPAYAGEGETSISTGHSLHANREHTIGSQFGTVHNTALIPGRRHAAEYSAAPALCLQPFGSDHSQASVLMMKNFDFLGEHRQAHHCGCDHVSMRTAACTVCRKENAKLANDPLQPVERCSSRCLATFDAMKHMGDQRHPSVSHYARALDVFNILRWRRQVLYGTNMHIPFVLCILYWTDCGALEASGHIEAAFQEKAIV